MKSVFCRVSGKVALAGLCLVFSTWAQAQNAANGKILFEQNCAVCHGGPDNVGPATAQAITSQIQTNPSMTFLSFLSTQDRADIAAYLNAPNSAQTFTLNITFSGSGSGTVSGTASGSQTAINCVATCSNSLTSGDIARLTATPAAGSVFIGWNTPNVCTNAGLCSVGINSNLTLFPIFYKVKSLSMRGGIDIDGNGKSAIPIRSTGSSMMIGRLANNTQLQFTPFVGPGANFRLVGAVDFDGNGKSDLAYQDFVSDPVFGDVRVWTDFSSAGDHLLRTVKLAWAVEAFGDLDGDGFGDMVFRFRGDDGVPNDTGVSYIWFVNADGSLTVRKRGGAPLSWTLLGAADLNYDGAADMIYVSPDNIIKALMATPGRTCANLNAGTVPAGYSVLKLADFTGNRRGDILIRNATTGDTQLLSLNGTGLQLPPYTGLPDDINASCTPSTLVVTNTAIGLPPPPAGSQFFAAGDFNGDGITDIVWVQPSNGQLTLWLMNAAGVLPTVVANAGTAPAGFTVFQP